MHPMLLSESEAEPKRARRRMRRDPRPHFKTDRSAQLDALQGCPQLQVPAEHLAWRVLELVGKLDLRSVEDQYSSLGRHGYGPRRVLAVWVYASLVAERHATKVASRLETDAAFRLLSGGYAISGRTLRRFRQENGELFASLIEQTVQLAMEQGLVDPAQLAVDSVRLRAHASIGQVRTVERSQGRLEQLQQQAEQERSPEEQKKYQAKVQKHQEALQQCQKQGRSNVVLSCKDAGLMKFPNGASQPGHRVTMATVGVKQRLVLHVLMDADGTDFGKLGPALVGARKVLVQSGMSPQTVLQAAADAGYYSQQDLLFGQQNAQWVDLLLPERELGGPTRGSTKYFTAEQFQMRPDGTAVCPAGRLMKGPYKDHPGCLRWQGSGCGDCALRPQCTSGKQRNLSYNVQMAELRRGMRERMARPGAKQRYNQRIATVEPVFSHLEDQMGFRRLSSRHSQTIVTEILLNVLAHNLSRLLAARPLLYVPCSIELFWPTL